MGAPVYVVTNISGKAAQMHNILVNRSTGQPPLTDWPHSQKAKYEGILDDLEENIDAFSKNVGELDTTLEDVKQTMNSG